MGENNDSDKNLRTSMALGFRPNRYFLFDRFTKRNDISHFRVGLFNSCRSGISGGPANVAERAFSAKNLSGPQKALITLLSS